MALRKIRKMVVAVASRPDVRRVTAPGATIPDRIVLYRITSTEQGAWRTTRDAVEPRK